MRILLIAAAALVGGGGGRPGADAFVPVPSKISSPRLVCNPGNAAGLRSVESSRADHRSATSAKNSRRMKMKSQATEVKPDVSAALCSSSQLLLRVWRVRFEFCDLAELVSSRQFKEVIKEVNTEKTAFCFLSAYCRYSQIRSCFVGR